jgi:hypothetical protein
MGLLCVALVAVLGLCLAFPAIGEEPGDALLEVFEKDIKPAESLLSPGVTVVEEFQPGAGDAIGTVKSLKGRMLVVHRGEKSAYTIQKNDPLFSLDTLVTEKNTRTDIEFNDKSSITLGTYTKIVLDKSIYDPSKSTRESFLRLLFGKARFIVTKLANFRSSQYKVKTPTAVVGVRGSDFAVAVAPGSPLTTTLATGRDTTVIFVGDTGPPQVIGPMQAATAKAGGAASAGLNITHFPPTWAAGGMPKYMKVGLGVGAAAVVGGVLAAGSDSNSGPPALAVTSFSPDESFLLDTVVTNKITFNFNRVIDIPPSVQLIAVDPDWQSSVSVTNNNTTIEVNVFWTGTAMGPTDGVTIDLGGITADGGNTPLTGKTQYSYFYG